MLHAMTIMLLLCLLAACAPTTPEAPPVPRAALAPCPDRPNCVFTMDPEPARAMAPLPLRGTGRESLDLLVTLLGGMKRCTLVTVTPEYVHAEFRSALFRFVDDVEFLIDPEAACIHFRSASRTGYYDFGVNRKRMTEISARYLNTPTAPP